MAYGPVEGPTNIAEDFLNAIEELELQLVKIKELFCGGELTKERLNAQLSEAMQCVQFIEQNSDNARTLHNEMIGE